jgi:hypothetical protein
MASVAIAPQARVVDTQAHPKQAYPLCALAPFFEKRWAAFQVEQHAVATVTVEAHHLLETHYIFHNLNDPPHCLSTHNYHIAYSLLFKYEKF